MSEANNATNVADIYKYPPTYIYMSMYAHGQCAVTWKKLYASWNFFFCFPLTHLQTAFFLHFPHLVFLQDFFCPLQVHRAGGVYCREHRRRRHGALGAVQTRRDEALWPPSNVPPPVFFKVRKSVPRPHSPAGEKYKGVQSVRCSGRFCG